jgi:hypothetical protein
VSFLKRELANEIGPLVVVPAAEVDVVAVVSASVWAVGPS